MPFDSYFMICSVCPFVFLHVLICVNAKLPTGHVLVYGVLYVETPFRKVVIDHDGRDGSRIMKGGTRQ